MHLQVFLDSDAPTQILTLFNGAAYLKITLLIASYT